MAYYDYNGTITIDEQAAANDIYRIQNALPILDAARKSIRQVMEVASTSQGEAGRAILEKSEELCNELNRLTKSLENTAVYIQNTVNHYRQLDLEVKAAIAAAALGED